LIEQHCSAAAEFHNAAQDVEDSEALRVLSLLEKHHQRLANIVKSHTATPLTVSKDVKDVKVGDTAPDLFTSTPNAEAPRTLSATSTTNVPSPLRSRRDAPSSIATNLATARGIPHQPAAFRARQMSPPASTPTSKNLQRVQVPKPVPAINTPSSQSQPPLRSLYQHPPPTTNDDAFQKFYSSFGGLVSRLTAPLAFAGLPLHPDDVTPATSSRSSTTLSDRITATSDDPAISRLFSRAALRAVQDRQGPSTVQESFFVVPTSGGTMPYSRVLTAQDKSMSSRHTRVTSTASDGPDHFVDAVQMQQQRPDVTSHTVTNLSPSIPTSRKSSSSTTITKPGTTQKTLEELELENASLKQLTDKLSHRLYDWEKNAQNQSIALQQSILSLNSQRVPSKPPTKEDAATTLHQDKDMLALEQALERAQKDLERFGRENEKLKTVVLRYRERWEKLKEGARVRREREDKGKDEGAKEGQQGSRDDGDGEDG